MGIVSSCLRGIFGGAAAGGELPTHVTVNGSRYKIGRLLGEGGFAFVYEGTDERSGRAVAVKRFVINEREALENVQFEAEVHREVSPHDNIISYVGHESHQRAAAPANRGPRTSLVGSENDPAARCDLWLVMEMANGSLRAAVDERVMARARESKAGAKAFGTQPALPPAGSPGKAEPLAGPGSLFSRQEIVTIMDDLVHALGHLHSQSPPVAHHDVKIENVLIVDGRYKLCDFGSAKRQSITCMNVTQVNRASVLLDNTMTLLYRPPESLDLWLHQRVDEKADVWALGVIVYVLLTGEMPFEQNPRQVIANEFTPIAQRLRDDPTVGPLCDMVVEGMLVADPAQRWDIFTVSERLHRVHASHRVLQPLGAGHRQMPPMFE